MTADLTPQQLEAWLSARSIARGVPAPVRERGGWRVDTGSAAELCRYVFLEADAAFRAAADAIDSPRVFLKACAPAADVLAIVPSRWTVQSVAWMMVQDPHCDDPVSLPEGYALDLTTQRNVSSAVITDAAGTLAASGYGAMAGGVFCYDRIVTQPDHRRRGLGRAIMGALGQRQAPETLRMLAATDAGRALYETMGWLVVAPYTTIELLRA